MPSETKTAGTCDADGSGIASALGSPNSVETKLDVLRAQYLATIFSMSPDTAIAVAVLAFGEIRQ